MHPSLEAGATIDVLPDVACWACLRHLIEINIVCTCPLGCLRLFSYVATQLALSCIFFLLHFWKNLLIVVILSLRLILLGTENSGMLSFFFLPPFVTCTWLYLFVILTDQLHNAFLCCLLHVVLHLFLTIL